MGHNHSKVVLKKAPVNILLDKGGVEVSRNYKATIKKGIVFFKKSRKKDPTLRAFGVADIAKTAPSFPRDRCCRILLKNGTAYTLMFKKKKDFLKLSEFVQSSGIENVSTHQTVMERPVHDKISPPPAVDHAKSYDASRSSSTKTEVESSAAPKGRYESRVALPLKNKPMPRSPSTLSSTSGSDDDYSSFSSNSSSDSDTDDSSSDYSSSTSDSDSSDSSTSSRSSTASSISRKKRLRH